MNLLYANENVNGGGIRKRVFLFFVPTSEV